MNSILSKPLYKKLPLNFDKLYAFKKEDKSVKLRFVFLPVFLFPFLELLEHILIPQQLISFIEEVNAKVVVV